MQLVPTEMSLRNELGGGCVSLCAQDIFFYPLQLLYRTKHLFLSLKVNNSIVSIAAGLVGQMALIGMVYA